MKLEYTVFGESHGPAIGVVVENLPSGIPIDESFISREMNRRRAKGDGLSTPRVEADVPQIISGVFEGKTTGTPLCAIIQNGNTRSGDYDGRKIWPGRPTRILPVSCGIRAATITGAAGIFPGRLTAPLVFAGAVAKLALREREIFVGAHVLQVGAEKDIPFSKETLTGKAFEALAEKDFTVLDDEAGERMKVLIQEARMNLTSVGGIIQCAVIGMPCGIGSPDKDNLEGVIARNMFRVPAVKGIEFGLGFGFASAYGHEVNDEMRMENGKVVTETNHNGGILGGISNGMPIVFQTVIKPTASISREQKTVNLAHMQDETLIIKGRHDPCILSRASVVVESAAALSVLEALS